MMMLSGFSEALLSELWLTMSCALGSFQLHTGR